MAYKTYSPVCHRVIYYKLLELCNLEMEDLWLYATTVVFVGKRAGFYFHLIWRYKNWNILHTYHCQLFLAIGLTLCETMCFIPNTRPTINGYLYMWIKIRNCYHYWFFNFHQFFIKSPLFTVTQQSLLYLIRDWRFLLN